MISYDVLKFVIFFFLLFLVSPSLDQGQLAKPGLFIVLFLDNSDKVFLRNFLGIPPLWHAPCPSLKTAASVGAFPPFLFVTEGEC